MQQVAVNRDSQLVMAQRIRNCSSQPFLVHHHHTYNLGVLAGDEAERFSESEVVDNRKETVFSRHITEEEYVNSPHNWEL